MCKRLKYLENVMRTHNIENHYNGINGLDPDMFDEEFHEDFLGFLIDE